MKNKSIKISSWGDLEKFFKETNVGEETIVLTGWINTILNGKSYLRSLFFSRVSLDVFKNGIESKTERISDRVKGTKTTRK